MNKIALSGLLVVLFLFGMLPVRSLAQTTPDPGIPGSLTVTKANYDLGDLAYAPASFPLSVEVRGSVHYPTGLSGGPYPVLVFLHGRHSTCYETIDPTNVVGNWPCDPGFQSIISFDGYDYLAKNMASHGYIVISVSCNAINADDNSVADYGMQARAELMQHHLDLWNTWNTTGGGPFGSTFVGKLNMKNIGTMGHSRGGEGVVFHALYNRSLGSPYGIKAVLTLAPVDFLRQVLHGIPLMNVAPYCDGDVSDLQGVHFYDDARYSDTTDEAPKHCVLMMGANHNFFNTVWTPGSYVAGGADDWDDYIDPTEGHCGTTATGNKRYDTTKQKAALIAYASAFYRVYIGHESVFAPILDVADIVPPASSTLDTTNVFVSYHPGRTGRLDINRTDTTPAISVNTLGGTVVETGLVSSGICGGGLSIAPCGVSSFSDQEPHKGTMTQKGMGQMALRWNDTLDWYENQLPVAYQKISTYQSIQFRAAVNFKTSPAGTPLNFTVQLLDSAGAASNQVTSNNSHVLFYQPGSEFAELPKVVFNTIRIPLSSFSGVNLNKVRYIRFKFNKSAIGSVLISDLALISAECGVLNATYTDSMAPGHKVIFTNKTVLNTTDSIAWHWDFGEPGAGDTSSLQNPPAHTYTANGIFTACLYVSAYRKSGLVCSDTFCKTVIIAPAAIQEQPESQVSIIPNPAKDYLQINGAEKTDVLKLINLYGQVVFTSVVTEPIIYLPQTIPTGIYYAVVATQKGNIYKKLLIAR
jgi:PKD repeat protein